MHWTRDGGVSEGREGVRGQACNIAGNPTPLGAARPPRRAIDKTEKSSVIGEILNRRFLAVSGSFKSIAPCSEKAGSSHDIHFP